MIGKPQWTLADVLEVFDVDREGRVFSNTRISKGKQLKGWVNSSGYRQVRCFLPKTGKKCDPLVHRLVAFKFIDNPDNLPLINHKDGDTLNNCVDNLEWCDHSGNLKHAYDTGLTSKKGVLHPLARLTEQDVLSIRSRRDAGEICKSIAKDFGIDDTTVSKIGTRSMWKHL